MRLRLSEFALLVSLVTLFPATAMAQLCDAHREPWMDALNANDIKAVDVAVDFDLFPDNRLALHVKSVRFFTDYVMNGFSETKPDLATLHPRDLENQLVPAALQQMERPLREELAKQITQGRGWFSYPLYDNPCRSAEYFPPRILGLTPIENRPAGKRLAVISDIQKVDTLGELERLEIVVFSDDGHVYRCTDYGLNTVFKRDQNVTIHESKGFLTIRSTDTRPVKRKFAIISKDAGGAW